MAAKRDAAAGLCAAGYRASDTATSRSGGRIGWDSSGYARNLDDGRVEVYAVGPEKKLSELAGMLHRGPRWADVRGVDEEQAAVQEYGSFHIDA